MARKPTAQILNARRNLASLIHTALERGQDAATREARWKPWSNQGFAKAVLASEAAVRTWRDSENPIRPQHIVKILDIFYGENPKFALAKKAMHDAWRIAGGYLPDEPEPPPVRYIQTNSFSGFAEVVDLEVSQPTPDNNGNLLVPLTLRIHPDLNCEYEGKLIEIGVTAPYIMVESEHWRPNPDSIFRGGKHPNVKGVGRSGAIQIISPKDGQGRIDGAPLEDEPRITMEPLTPDADGPITFSVRVAREGFKVTLHDEAQMTDAQTAVLDAIFANQAFPKDDKKRLIVASETVTPWRLPGRNFQT